MKTKAKNLFSTLRPKQWVKNLLLLIAPFFSAGIELGSNLGLLFLGLISFSIASSFGYIINDFTDLQIDRKHPVKKLRPLASGAISFRAGYVLLGYLAVLLFVFFLVLPIKFVCILIVYLLNTYLYTRYVKLIPVLELFSVSLGFVLRLIAGGLLLGLPISEWFVIVGGFGATFIVASKRLAEKRESDTREVRKVLDRYSSEFLNSVATTSLSVCLTAYCFWAFSHQFNEIWYQTTIVPFTVGLFRYRWLSEGSIVEAPEDAFLHDKWLLLSTCLIAFALSIAVYV